MNIRVLTDNFLKTIQSNMVKVTHVELRYSSNETNREIMQPDKFMESLEHLSKSNIFADCIDWTYERVHASDREDYIVMHSGCMFFLIDVELQTNDGVSANDVEKKFRETIFDRVFA